MILRIPWIILFCSVHMRKGTMPIRRSNFEVTIILDLPSLFTLYTRPPWSLFPILTVSQYALFFNERYPTVTLVLLKSNNITFIGLESWDFHLIPELVKTAAWRASQTYILETWGIFCIHANSEAESFCNFNIISPCSCCHHQS